MNIQKNVFFEYSILNIKKKEDIYEYSRRVRNKFQLFGIHPKQSKRNPKVLGLIQENLNTLGLNPIFLGSIPKSWEFLCFFILEIGDELGFFGVNWDLFWVTSDFLG